MPSNLKPIGAPVDIQDATSTVNDATLVSVLNTSTAVALVAVTETSSSIYLNGGERVTIVKDSDHTLDGTAGDAAIWATAIAYRA